MRCLIKFVIPNVKKTHWEDVAYVMHYTYVVLEYADVPVVRAIAI